MPSLSAYRLIGDSFTLDVGYLFMAAPAKHSRSSLPWTWGISSRLLLLTLDLGYLTEEEDIKKRWQEYTEELYKKDLHHPDNHQTSWNVKSKGS